LRRRSGDFWDSSRSPYPDFVWTGISFLVRSGGGPQAAPRPVGDEVPRRMAPGDDPHARVVRAGSSRMPPVVPGSGFSGIQRMSARPYASERQASHNGNRHPSSCQSPGTSGTGVPPGKSAFAGLARTNHKEAAHLANHLAASGFVLPRRITQDMPWSSSPAGGQSITQSGLPPCDLFGRALTGCRPSLSSSGSPRASTGLRAPIPGLFNCQASGSFGIAGCGPFGWEGGEESAMGHCLHFSRIREGGRARRGRGWFRLPESQTQGSCVFWQVAVLIPSDVHRSLARSAMRAIHGGRLPFP
jgi:hypothetical protein